MSNSEFRNVRSQISATIDVNAVLVALAVAEFESLRADGTERAGLVAAQQVVRAHAGIPVGRL